MLVWKYLRWALRPACWLWLASVWLLPGPLAAAPMPAHTVLDANALPPVSVADDAVTTLDAVCVLPDSDMLPGPPGPQAAWQHVALPHL